MVTLNGFCFGRMITRCTAKLLSSTATSNLVLPTEALYLLPPSNGRKEIQFKVTIFCFRFTSFQCYILHYKMKKWTNYGVAYIYTSQQKSTLHRALDCTKKISIYSAAMTILYYWNTIVRTL